MSVINQLAKKYVKADATSLSMLDTAFIKHMKTLADNVDDLAAQLQIVAAKGNAGYLSDLQKRVKVKHLMELASWILAQ